MFEYDKFKLYCGDDTEIKKGIIVTQPTLLQIKNFGESRYFSAIKTLTSVGADMKWQLMDWYNIDYTQIDDYDLFLKLLYPSVSSKKKLYNEIVKQQKQEELSKEELNELFINPLELVLKDIDLADFELCQLQSNNDIVLYNKERDITIDRLCYHNIVEVVRSIHGFKRNNEIPANERTKLDLIDDARDEALASRNKPFESVLLSLVSFLSVKTGHCGDGVILNMKIGMFFDNIKRATKIKDTELLLQGAYSGFSSLKGIDESRLNWTSNID